MARGPAPRPARTRNQASASPSLFVFSFSQSVSLLKLSLQALTFSSSLPFPDLALMINDGDPSETCDIYAKAMSLPDSVGVGTAIMHSKYVNVFSIFIVNLVVFFTRWNSLLLHSMAVCFSFVYYGKWQAGTEPREALKLAQEHLEMCAKALRTSHRVSTRNKVVLRRNIDAFERWRQGGYEAEALRMSFVF